MAAKELCKISKKIGVFLASLNFLDIFIGALRGHFRLALAPDYVNELIACAVRRLRQRRIAVVANHAFELEMLRIRPLGMKAFKAVLLLSGNIHGLPPVVATDIRGLELVFPSRT